MIKRDKGIFHRKDAPIEKKLEEELDRIVKAVNQTIDTKDKEIEKLQKDITNLVKASKVSGGSASGKISGSVSVNTVAYNEQIIYGANNISIIKDFGYADTKLNLTNLRNGDIIESIIVITKTVDNGITDFKVNDGVNDLMMLNNVDFSTISANAPAKAMWVEYTSGAELTMYLAGATTLVGKIVIKILRRPTI